MGSIFQRTLSRTEYTQDRIFGTGGWTFSPMRTPPLRAPTSDPDRAVIMGMTVIFENLSVNVILGEEERQSSRPLISVQSQYVPEGVIKGDRFTSPDGIVYQVDFVHPDHMTRYRCDVVEQGP